MFHQEASVEIIKLKFDQLQTYLMGKQTDYPSKLSLGKYNFYRMKSIYYKYPQREMSLGFPGYD